MESVIPQPEYSADGVDLSLIEWMLSLTPAERLAFHEQQINSILAIWDYNPSLRPPWYAERFGGQTADTGE